MASSSSSASLFLVSLARVARFREDGEEELEACKVGVSVSKDRDNTCVDGRVDGRFRGNDGPKGVSRDDDDEDGRVGGCVFVCGGEDEETSNEDDAVVLPLLE